MYVATVYDICFKYVDNNTFEEVFPTDIEKFQDADAREKKFSFVSYCQILGTVTARTFKELHEKTFAYYGNMPLGLAIKKISK